MADGPAPGVNSAMLASMREHSGDSHSNSGASVVGGSAGSGLGMEAAAFGGENFTDSMLGRCNIDGSFKAQSLESLSQFFGEGAMNGNPFTFFSQNTGFGQEKFEGFAQTGFMGQMELGDATGLASNFNAPKSGPNPLMPSKGHQAGG